jgi:L-fuculose-phosphate aldolase|tara:strand:- start:4097 stop:4738 length:642 start_codon:yes stop_codon:yes gene_type:complete
MLKKEIIIRNKIIQACLDMEKKGLNQGKAGNISVRWKDGMLITPSGISYEGMKAKDIVFVDAKTKSHGLWSPSSEWRFHFDILQKRKEFNTVIHNHPAYGTGMSMLGKDIKAYHYMIAFLGGDSIRCSTFAIPGSQELSNVAIKALKGRKACLLANHGAITCGKDLEEALFLTEEFEILCKQITIAKLNGKPQLVEKRHMKKIIEAIKSYGKY